MARRSVDRLCMGVAVDEGPAPRRMSRRVTTILLGALAPALIAGVCLVESSVESRQIMHSHRVATVTRVLQQQAAARGDDLRALEMLLRPRNELDWRMFDDLARFGVLERDDVAACAWIPRVPARHRAQYETFVEVSAYRSFRISERDEYGRLRDAGVRDEHYPLHFVSPAESSGLPLGIDTAADPEVEAAMERARDGNTVSALLTNAWGRESGEAAMLVLLPVYRPYAPLDSVQGRRVALEGFLMASLLLAPEVGAAVKETDLGEVQANLTSAGRRPRPFSPLDTGGPWLTTTSGQSTTMK
jgi:CHASE1-domain containing sensor protein